MVLLTGTASGATGTFTVTSGTLEVGSAATPGVTYGGNVTVQAGGTLAGHGTVSGSVTNGGTVAPGGTIGTLTVTGNYTQGAGDTLAIEANPTTLERVGGERVGVAGGDAGADVRCGGVHGGDGVHAADGGGGCRRGRSGR